VPPLTTTRLKVGEGRITGRLGSSNGSASCMPANAGSVRLLGNLASTGASADSCPAQLEAEASWHSRAGRGRTLVLQSVRKSSSPDVQQLKFPCPSEVCGRDGSPFIIPKKVKFSCIKYHQ
jgi:hypothetical protein